MVEFSLCAAALVLLLLGTWTISGYQEVQRRAIVAARQAAFEGAWLAEGLRIDEERLRLGRQHFDDAGLVDATGKTRLVSAQSVQLQAQSGPAPGQGTTAFEVLIAPLRAAGGFLGGGFDLANRGFRTGAVVAETQVLPHLPAPFRDLQLRFRQPYALLSDGWNAGGPAQVSQRAGGLVPSSALSGLAGLWSAMSVPLAVIEPSLGQLCPALIEPDRVPEDRLSPGQAQRDATCR
jgi:hypothetical protein